VLSPLASQDIYERAGEPKRLVVLPGVEHGLAEAADEVRRLVREWLVAQLAASLRPAAPEVEETTGWLTVVPGPEGVVREVVVAEGDISAMAADAIVCPGNDELMLVGAVGRALAARAGPALQAEAQGRAPAPVGSAIATGAGDLAARHVIHAVTTSFHRGFPAPNEAILEAATRASLDVARDLDVKTLALPALGTGGGGYPAEKAARVMVGAVLAHLGGETTLEKVVFCLQPAAVYRAFLAELRQRG
jgi:O-acetyl-ADP-ribose deacetylase (regulator of RNase III)